MSRADQPCPAPSTTPARTGRRRVVGAVALLALACGAAAETPAAGRSDAPSPSAPPPLPEPVGSFGPGTVRVRPLAASGSWARARERADVSPRGAWPLDPRPRVVARFSPPQVRWSSGHRGVDLAGRPGQPVLAARDGVVRHAGKLAGRGVVSVEHADGTRTTYEPLLVDVARGDAVGSGDRLGWLVVTGSHCAPAACLHWGWRRGEEYLDPLALVGATPVRLLPLTGEPVGGR